MTASTHKPRRAPEEQAKLETTLHEIFERLICFNEALGFKIASLKPENPSLSFSMRPDLVGHYLHGRLHGGVIATVLDTVGGLAVAVGVSEKFPDESADQIVARYGRLGTIDLRTDFLQQGIGKIFTASGKVTRLGGRIVSTQMALHNENGLLIATGCGTYVIS